jgi:MFS family permease
MSLASPSTVVGPEPPDIALENDWAGLAWRYWVSTLVVVILLWASSAPSVLYPLWAAEWGFSSLTQTSIYSCYPVALILVLLFGGGISDQIGRRRAMLVGMAVIASACLLLIVAPGLGWLYASRILQGLGTGLALGASNAAIVESEPTGDTARASATITVASAAGLIVGPILTGTMVEYAPFPLHLGLIVLLALILVTMGLLVGVRNAGGPTGPVVHAERRRPRTISVPRRLWPVFGVAALAVTASYASGALALSLGAQMARELVQTSNALVIGLLLALTPVGIVAVALGLRQPRPTGAMLVGGLITTAGINCLLLTALTGQLGLFVLALALSGLGQGLLILGGLGLATANAPIEYRGQTLSAVYLIAYLGQAVTAISVGLLAVRLDLHRALDLFTPLMILACLASSGLAWRELRRIIT